MLAEIIAKLSGFTKEEDHPFSPRPSLAGAERCTRQMVYWGLGFKRTPMTDRFMMVLDDSKWAEELTADWLRKSAYKLHSEQMKISCPPPMKSGSIDWLLTDMMGNDYLVEHKAISHFSFNAYWDGKDPVDYFTQTCIYLWGLQIVQPDIKRAILLIKNKNTAQYMEFILYYDKVKDELTVEEKVDSTGERQYPKTIYKDIVTNACKKFDYVLDCIAKNHLPKRDYELSDWQCDYCGWKNECYKNFKQEFEALGDGAELDGEAENLCAHYLELSMHISNMEKEKDEHKEKIKALLEAKQAKQGRAGEYVVTMRLQERTSLDKTLIPADILAKATKINPPTPVLSIRKPAKKKGGKNAESV